MCRSRIGCGAAASSPARACSISPAARSCISTPASPAWSRPASSARGAATARDNLAPYDLSLAVIGTGLLVGRLVRLQRRLGARRQFARRLRDRRDASRRLRRRAHLDGPGVVDSRQAVGARHDLGRGRRPRHHHAGLGLRAALARRRHRPDRRRRLLLGLHELKLRFGTTTRSTCSACTASAAPPARCSPACSRSRRCRRARDAADVRAARGQRAAGADPALRRRRDAASGRASSTFVLLKVIGFFLPLRVRRSSTRRIGLDIILHGESLQ